MDAEKLKILGDIFDLLERIEVVDSIDFSQYDPDDDGDVKTIVEKYIGPFIAQSSCEYQDSIRYAISRYVSTGTVPFQLMKDRCQELTLPDADSWELFFIRIWNHLFGK